MCNFYWDGGQEEESGLIQNGNEISDANEVNNLKIGEKGEVAEFYGIGRCHSAAREINRWLEGGGCSCV